MIVLASLRELLYNMMQWISLGRWGRSVNCLRWMVNMRSLAYRTLGIVVVVAISCPAAPNPAIIPGLGDWTLEVRFEQLQQIRVPLSGDSRPQLFWYTIITLTNKTGEQVDFYPQCELMTDSFQILPADVGVPSDVFERIKQRHESKYPFLESTAEAGNRILHGQDNAKDVAIVWPDFDPRAKRISVFITGLSNETAVVNHPTATDAGGAKKVHLRKTLELNYALRGDPALRSDVQPDYQGKRWVMR